MLNKTLFILLVLSLIYNMMLYQLVEPKNNQVKQMQKEVEKMHIEVTKMKYALGEVQKEEALLVYSHQCPK